MSLLDLDSLLDSNLDNVEDIPDFLNPPTGAYILDIAKADVEAFKNKAGEEGHRFRITFKIVATKELKDPKTPPVADGTLFSVTNQVTDDGKKYFKKLAKQILNAQGDELAGATIRDLLTALAEIRNMEAFVTTQEKNGYENVRVRPVWAAEESESAED